MIKFYSINNELDVDTDFNDYLDEIQENNILKGSWSGNSQSENILDIIVDRFNFFIESGSISSISKFNNGYYDEKTYDSHGNTISEKKETNKWDFGRYHILRYHLVQDLKDKLSNLDILDLDSLSIEYRIDKGFLIDFIFALLNKDLIEISLEENKSLLKVKSNLDQILNLLEKSIDEMEMGLVA